MSSLAFVQERNLMQKGVAQNVTTDSPVAIRIRKVGTESATSVVVTTATNIVLTGSTTTDTIAFATYTTLAAVVAAINATGRWEAKLLDALSTQASASTLLAATITAGTDGNGVVVWDVNQDTSTALQFVTCISPHRDFDVVKGRRVHVIQIKYLIDLGTAAVDSVQIFKRSLGKGSGVLASATEVKVTSYLSVDNSSTTITWASGLGRITSNVNEELIVLVKDAATLADATTNFLEVVGIIE